MTRCNPKPNAMRNVILRVITLIVINITASAQDLSRYSASYASDSVVVIFDEREARSYYYEIKCNYSLDFTNYTIMHNDSSFYLISNTSSEIFRSENNKFAHFVYDLEQRANLRAPYVFVDTTLFSYGGYGFWSTNNILRTWNNYSGWSPVIFPESSKALVRSYGASLYSKDSIIYIVGGTLTSEKNALVEMAVPFLQKVDLKNRDVQIEPLPIDYNVDKLVHITGDSLIIRSDNEMFLYRISLNTAQRLEPTEKYYKALQQEAMFLQGTSFYNSSKAVMYPFDDFFLVSAVKNPFSITLELVIGFFIWLFMVIIIIRIKHKKPKRVSYKDNCIQCGKNTLLLEPYEAEIMRLFTHNGTLTSEVIATVLPENISESHRNRTKLELIKSINQKIANISSQTDVDAITRHKDFRDSRMSVYSLREDIIIEGK